MISNTQRKYRNIQTYVSIKRQITVTSDALNYSDFLETYLNYLYSNMKKKVQPLTCYEFTYKDIIEKFFGSLYI